MWKQEIKYVSNNHIFWTPSQGIQEENMIINKTWTLKDPDLIIKIH